MHITKLKEGFSNIYFSGIGGISMSALAKLLFANGYKVSGSDIQYSDSVKSLIDSGIDVHLKQVSQNITDDIDLFVYTVAIPENSQELLEAQKRNIKILDRASLLGEILSCFDKSICVSGTHGKSSTTSFLSTIFLDANIDPTISVGGHLKTIKGNFYAGDSEYFIAEACEYFDSFLQFNPHSAIILNVELEHIDYFDNEKQLIDSFHTFASNISEDGFLVINSTIPSFDDIVKNTNCKIITFGDENSDFYAHNIVYDNKGCGSFDLIHNGSFLKRITLNIAGFHNILNSLSAIAMAYAHNINIDIICHALKNFAGLNRRFQVVGEYDGITIIDDYAHHPTEINCALATAKRIQKKSLWLVFQPHTYSRTIDFFDDFVDSLAKGDKTILLDIFSAREPISNLIHSKDIHQKLVSKGQESYYFSCFDECENFLMENAQTNDVILTMGAGNSYKIGHNILSKKGISDF